MSFSPGKEFCWVAPVRVFQKNMMVWVPFLSEVLSYCTLGFPRRACPRHRAPSQEQDESHCPHSQECPRAHAPIPAGTEASGGAVCNPWQDVAARSLAGPFVVVAASVLQSSPANCVLHYQSLINISPFSWTLGLFF